METLNTPNWYIAYTIPFREKKVVELLSQKNIEYYRPMKKAKLQYSSLFKTSYEPLLPSCIFVYVAPVELSFIKSIYEVINLVHWLGKPAIIRNEEIDAIKKFLSLYIDVILEKIPVRTNGTISVMDSHLIKGDGMVQDVINGLVKVRLPSLGYALKASVSLEFIKTADTLLFDNNQQPPLSGKVAGQLSKNFYRPYSNEESYKE